MKSIKRIFVLGICTILLLVLVISTISGCSEARAMDSPYLENQAPMSGKVSQDMIGEIESFGLSSGNATFLYEEKDYYGNSLIACADDMYIYTFDSQNRLVSARIRDELRDNYHNKSLLSKEQYYEKAKNFMQRCLPSFNPKTTELLCSLSEDSAYLTLYDRQDYCVVNTGVIIFAGDGTITHISGTSNSIKDFEGTDKFNETAIREIVYKSLMQYKEVVEKEGLPEADEPEKPDTWSKEEYLDEGLGKEIVELPKYELFVNSISDVNFTRMQKEKVGDTIIWSVHAQLDTSWGEVDPALSFTFVFTIDAKTGEIIQVETLATDPEV